MAMRSTTTPSCATRSFVATHATYTPIQEGAPPALAVSAARMHDGLTLTARRPLVKTTPGRPGLRSFDPGPSSAGETTGPLPGERWGSRSRLSRKLPVVAHRMPCHKDKRLNNPARRGTTAAGIGEHQTATGTATAIAKKAADCPRGTSRPRRSTFDPPTPRDDRTIEDMTASPGTRSPSISEQTKPTATRPTGDEEDAHSHPEQ